MPLDLGLTCTSTVCLNGGSCTVNGNTAQCICPSSFAGARCEWSKTERMHVFHISKSIV